MTATCKEIRCFVIRSCSFAKETMEASEHEASATAEALQGSDECDNVMQCEQCQENGQFEVATAFCSNCNDYLCRGCVTQHNKLRASKDHKVLDGTDMPREKPRIEGTEYCTEHPEKPIELFCRHHNSLECVLCISESHRQCPDVASISKMSRDEETSKELRDVKTSAEGQSTTLAYCRQLIDEYNTLNDMSYDKSSEVFETFKAEISACLDVLGKRVHAEALELKKRNKGKLESFMASLVPLEEMLKSRMAAIEVKEATKQMDQVFIAMKKNASHIAENGAKLELIKEGIRIQRFTFDVDPTVKQTIEKMAGIRTLEMLSGDIRCLEELNIRSPEDTKTPFVTAIAEISSSEIVVADTVNQCLKQIAVDKNIILQKRPLRSDPRDITVLPGSRVAVTLTGLREIRFFSTENHLEPCGRVRVNGQCLAIRCTGNKLVVSFWDSGRVQILDFDGNVLQSVTSDTAATQLFGKPRYLSLSTDLSLIYVSDHEKNAVTCLDTAGSVRWTFKDEDMKYPLGVTTSDDGCLYVCARDSNNIHVLTSGGVKLRVISLAQVSLRYPQAVCRSHGLDSLYVSNGSDDPKHQNCVARLSLQ